MIGVLPFDQHGSFIVAGYQRDGTEERAGGRLTHLQQCHQRNGREEHDLEGRRIGIARDLHEDLADQWRGDRGHGGVHSVRADLRRWPR